MNENCDYPFKDRKLLANHNDIVWIDVNEDIVIIHSKIENC